MFSNKEERAEFIDLVAQAVIDKIEERDRITGLADMVVARVLSLQEEEASLKAEEAQVQQVELSKVELSKAE